MKIIKRSDNMRNILFFKSLLVHSVYQRHIKSPLLLITSEIRLFILCTNVVDKSLAKDFQYRFITGIKN